MKVLEQEKLAITCIHPYCISASWNQWQLMNQKASVWTWVSSHKGEDKTSDKFSLGFWFCISNLVLHSQENRFYPFWNFQKETKVDFGAH